MTSRSIFAWLVGALILLPSMAGAQVVWHQLCEVPRDQLSREEVWVYGCELVRELEQVELVDGPDRPALGGSRFEGGFGVLDEVGQGFCPSVLFADKVPVFTHGFLVCGWFHEFPIRTKSAG